MTKPRSPRYRETMQIKYFYSTFEWENYLWSILIVIYHRFEKQRTTVSTDQKIDHLHTAVEERVRWEAKRSGAKAAR